MDKSPDAFRTISEVAEDLDVPQHVLRFWETRFSHIKPLKRGGGRRYYRPDDIDLLRGIRHLLYGEGYTIKGVQRILKEDGPRLVQSIGRGDARAPAPPANGGGGDEPGEEDESADVAVLAKQGRKARPVAEEKPGAGLDPSDIELLKAALDELVECGRVLKTLRAPEEPPLDEAD